MEYGRPFELDGPERRKRVFKRCEYCMGTTGDGDVPDRFDSDGSRCPSRWLLSCWEERNFPHVDCPP